MRARRAPWRRAKPATGGAPHLAAMLELSRGGAAPLRARGPSFSEPLRIAAVIPSFRRGSGGHMTIVSLLRAAAAQGHSVSLWLEDCEGRHAGEPESITRSSFASFFDAHELPLHPDLSDWEGADVVLATGWQTVARALLLTDVGARAYLVQDHEPDFYPASAERLWAAGTYALGLHCVAASPWLAELLRRRYGASASHFDLALDHSVYRPDEAQRREDLVVFYARAATPRRAVPLGLAALALLAERRPDLELALYGEPGEQDVAFPARQLGVLGAGELASLYSRATVGVVLSMTNPSLVNLEMMACGLPCVELASESMRASFSGEGPLSLAEADPRALSEAIERLLGDRALRERRAREGLTLAGERTWERAAVQLIDGLRTAGAAGRQGSLAGG